MKTTVFSTHKFEEPYLVKANNDVHQLKVLENNLTTDSALTNITETDIYNLDCFENEKTSGNEVMID